MDAWLTSFAGGGLDIQNGTGKISLTALSGSAGEYEYTLIYTYEGKELAKGIGTITVTAYPEATVLA